MIEMAPETARSQEKREGRWGFIRRAVRRRSLQSFRRPKDVVHLPAYFVEKARKWSTFPSPFLLASRQMASHHFDQINRS
jgi:hypothetical protein